MSAHQTASLLSCPISRRGRLRNAHDRMGFVTGNGTDSCFRFMIISLPFACDVEYVHSPWLWTKSHHSTAPGNQGQIFGQIADEVPGFPLMGLTRPKSQHGIASPATDPRPTSVIISAILEILSASSIRERSCKIFSDCCKIFSDWA